MFRNMGSWGLGRGFTSTEVKGEKRLVLWAEGRLEVDRGLGVRV